MTSCTAFLHILTKAPVLLNIILSLAVLVNAKRCILKKETERKLPSDVKSWTYQACQAPDPNKTGLYSCEVINATEDVVMIKLKPSCVCPAYIFYPNITPHFCRESLKKMSCKNCSDFSPNKTGPCLNGGTLTCDGEKTVAEDIRCKCPPGYYENYCQIELLMCYLDSLDTYKTQFNKSMPVSCCHPLAVKKDREGIEDCDENDIKKINNKSCIPSPTHRPGESQTSQQSMISASPRLVLLLLVCFTVINMFKWKLS